MVKNIVVILTVVLLAALGTFFLVNPDALRSMSSAPKLKVLFIGSEVTGSQNGIPDMIQAMLSESQIDSVIDIEIYPEAYIKDHFGRASTVDKIKRGWDFVVLQANSYEAVYKKEEFFQYTKSLTQLIKDNKAMPVLMANWAHREAYSEYFALAQSFPKAARESQVMLAPVNAAFKIAHTKVGKDIIFADNTLASDAGKLLASYVLFMKLTGKGIEGLQYRSNVDLALSEKLKRIAVEGSAITIKKSKKPE